MLVVDGEIGVFRGELGGGICGCEGRSRASLNVDDIVASVSQEGKKESSVQMHWCLRGVVCDFPQVMYC